jgi:hypothetical protein
MALHQKQGVWNEWRAGIQGASRGIKNYEFPCVYLDC